MDVIVSRCAGLDVHKNTVMACVRAPGPDGGRTSTVRRFRTFTDSLRQLRAWLVVEGVTQVAMEATGVYWRPVWHVLEAVPEFELLLANAHAVKNMPGRKTDVADAEWLALLCECGLLRASFVPPPVIAELRDLTRYRKKLIEERTRETQRVQKLLEDAGIKLDSVVSDILGVSARRMLEALIAGVRDVDALAELAHTRMRPKIPQLRRALEGRFGAHHALMLRMHLDHVDQLSAAIERLDVEVDRVIRPFSAQLQRLITIPGVGRRTAEVIIAEVGVDMRRFATAGHLASWAGMCPGNHESGGKRRSGRARKGNRALRAALCEAAWSAARSNNGYLPAQYRHLMRTFGKKGQTRAVFAVGHSILVIAWHLLANDCDYADLGAEHLTRHHRSRSPCTLPRAPTRSPRPQGERRTRRRVAGHPHQITDHPGYQPGRRLLRPERGWSPEFRLSPHAPVGRRAGVKALVRGCPPDAVVSLALEAVSQSGAGALDGLRTVATSTPVRFCESHRSPRAAPPGEAPPERRTWGCSSRSRCRSTSTNRSWSGSRRSTWPRPAGWCACGCRTRGSRAGG